MTSGPPTGGSPVVGTGHGSVDGADVAVTAVGARVTDGLISEVRHAAIGAMPH